MDSTGKVRVTAKSGFGCVPGGDLLMTPGIDPKVVGIEDGVKLYVRLPDQVPGCTYDITFELGVADLLGDGYVCSPALAGVYGASRSTGRTRGPA